MKRFIIVLGLLFFLSSFQLAEARSYDYDKIEMRATINADASIDIEETQTFNFSGSYHTAWRTIPIKAFSGLAEINVLDSRGEPLIYSKKQLSKDDPQSWGKYTFFRENGAENIVWYFGESNQHSQWTLKYKLHGALAFGGEFDRWYWNIFTDYEVPVKTVSVKVVLPEVYLQEQVKHFQYRSNSSSAGTTNYADGEVKFAAENFIPKEKYTIDLSWPRGAVDRAEFWKQFLLGIWGYLSAGLIFFVTSCIIIFWTVREGRKKGRGTIIPQYNPPENFKPLMAEIVTKGAASDWGIAATIIDLAVRGYLKIEEETQGVLDKISQQKNYKIIRTDQEFLEDMEDYEKELLDIYGVTESGKSFSTKEIKRGNNYIVRSLLIKSLAELKVKAVLETSTDTQAFDNPPNEKLRIFSVIILVLGTLFLTVIILGSSFLKQALFLIVALITAILLLFIFYKYQIRLSDKGHLLKEEWLGFKMYLKVAERYRMQNLTPEIFERYLSYAIVFRIEKQWVKNFNTITIPTPDWYVPSALLASGVGTNGNFSAASFVSSFPASFTSSISPSTGSGMAGGGSAGGGGGGGGGGAN